MLDNSKSVLVIASHQYFCIFDSRRLHQFIIIISVSYMNLIHSVNFIGTKPTQPRPTRNDKTIC